MSEMGKRESYRLKNKKQTKQTKRVGSRGSTPSFPTAFADDDGGGFGSHGGLIDRLDKVNPTACYGFNKHVVPVSAASNAHYPRHRRHDGGRHGGGGRHRGDGMGGGARWERTPPLHPLPAPAVDVMESMLIDGGDDDMGGMGGAMGGHGGSMRRGAQRMEEDVQPWYVINPNSYFWRSWNLLQALSIMFLVVSTPSEQLRRRRKN